MNPGLFKLVANYHSDYTLQQVKDLIEQGADPNYLSEPDSYGGRSFILDLVVRNNLETTKYLVSQGADPLHVSPNGDTPLRCAIRHGQVNIVKYLLKCGAKLTNEHLKEMLSIFTGNPSDLYNMTKIMIENKLDINTKDDNGQTLLFQAIGTENLKLLKLLVENGANVNIKDNENNTPLKYMIDVCEINNKKIEDLLIQHMAKK